MVDWKKDIRLSDLLARGKDDAEEVHGATAFHQGETGHEEPVAGPDDLETVDEGPAGEVPFWKRELSFRRQKDEVEPDAEAEWTSDEPGQRSFFKRDLGFRRAKRDDVGDADFDAPATGAEGKTPFWKRDLSFDAPVGEKKSFFKRELGFGRAKDPDFDAPESEKRSFFKRDLSFGRRKREPEADLDFPVAAAEKRPFFKRELSFRRAKGGGRDGAPKRSGGRVKQVGTLQG